MKRIYIALVFALICGFANAESLLTKEQAAKLAKVILSAEENVEYREIFRIENISYDSENDVWRFPAMGAHLMYVFEIRDKDGQYKIGTISDSSFGPAPPKFRIAPNLRREIRNLFEEFSKDRKK